MSAMYNLGVLLHLGAKGVPVDATRAKYWHERAIANDGHIEYNVGRG